MRFLAGFILGILALAGYLGYQHHEKKKSPCLSYCGEGTRCLDSMCRALDQGQAQTEKKRHRPRRRKNRGTAAADQAEPSGLRQPTRADLQTVARGPSLNGTDYIDLSAGGSPAARELDSAEVNERFRRLNPAILNCIDQARRDYNIEQGKVVIQLRIERTGEVNKMRLAAPAVLQRANLFNCLQPLVTGLRFRPSARSLVMSYPYTLH